jgi:hypothetical protein
LSLISQTKIDQVKNQQNSTSNVYKNANKILKAGCQISGGLVPLQTVFSFFQNIFFRKKETHMKNGENHMKEQNKSFQMVYVLPK